MTSISRRKQSKPKRLDADDDLPAPAALHTEETRGTMGSVDSHVCGFCSRHFFTLHDFLSHKKVCELMCPSSGLLSPPSSNETLPSSRLRCPLCPETPRTAAALDWHLTEAHEEARPLQCTTCAARQPTRRDMAAHLRLHHQGEGAGRRPNSTEPLPARDPLDGRASLPPLPGLPDGDDLAPDLEAQPRASPFSDLSRAPSPQQPLSLERPLDLSSTSSLEAWRGPDLYPGMFLGHSLFPPLSPSLLSAKDLSSDDDWESMMEVNQVDENEKIRQLVGDKPQPPVTDPNQCLICRRILSCKSALQMHYRTHTGERPFKCKICLRAFTTKGNLKTHMGVHRSKHPFRLQHQCPICQKRFLNSALLHQHVRLHTTHLTQRPPPFTPSPLTPPAQDIAPPPPNPFLLNLAALPQPPPPNREETPKREEGEPVEKAGRPTPPEEILGFNPATLLPPNPFGPGNPFAGLMMPTPPPPPTSTTPNGSARPSTTCNICFKTFACFSALEIHYRYEESHTGDKPFICPTCGRGFSTRGNMKQHLMTHKIRDAAAAAALHSHSSSPAVSEASGGSDARVVKEERVSPPSSITASITTSEIKAEPTPPPASTSAGPGPSPLESIKMMWAQTEPPAPRKTPVLSRHQCGVCFKHFSSSSALQIHMRTHTGDKPFKCTFCGRAFTTKGNLKVHMGTHMWNNPSRRGRRIFDFPLGLEGGEGGEGAGKAEEGKKEPPPFSFPLRPLLPPPVSTPALFPPPAAQTDAKHPMEAMLWMWRNVCSVCQKVCTSSSELEEHLKLHLQAGPRLAAAQGLLTHQ